jgi:hypothetical protein
LAEDTNRALVRRLEARKNIQQGGFPNARLSEQCHLLSRTKRKRKITKEPSIGRKATPKATDFYSRRTIHHARAACSKMHEYGIV